MKVFKNPIRHTKNINLMQSIFPPLFYLPLLELLKAQDFE